MIPSEVLADVQVERQAWLWGLAAAVFLSFAGIGYTSTGITLSAAVTVTAAVRGLVRHNGYWTAFVVGAFPLIGGSEPGLQPEELVYAVVLLAFLATWYGRRLWGRERILTDGFAAAAVGFGLWGILSYTWSLGLFGGTTTALTGDFVNQAMWFFYPPLACSFRRSGWGTPQAVLLLGWLALYAALRNMQLYLSALASADQAWKIATGRVAQNELVLMVGVLAMAVTFLYGRRSSARLLGAGIGLVALGALVLTQSRGYWASALIALVVLFVLVDVRRRIRIAGFGVMGIAGLIGALAIAVPQAFDLLVGGLVDRFSSLGTSGTSDGSLINRFYEARAALGQTLQNPILGYGFGRPLRYYSLVEDATVSVTFIHNGFVGLWYFTGLPGVLMVLTLWIGTMIYGLQLYRSHAAAGSARVGGLLAFVVLLGMLPVATTSTPFQMPEGPVILVLMAALVSGARLTLSRFVRRSSFAPDLP